MRTHNAEDDIPANTHTCAKTNKASTPDDTDDSGPAQRRVRSRVVCSGSSWPSVSPLVGLLDAFAHPATLHDVTLKVFGGQHQHFNCCHEVCAGGQNPAEGTRETADNTYYTQLHHLPPGGQRFQMGWDFLVFCASGFALALSGISCLSSHSTVERFSNTRTTPALSIWR